MFTQGSKSADSATQSQTEGAGRNSGEPSVISADLKIVGDLHCAGDVQIKGTVEGDIRLRKISGGVVARTVEGVIEVEDTEGSLELFSLDDDVWVSGAKGDLIVEAADGDIHLARIDARNVQASTVDGEVEFEGVIWPDGRYELTTHDGDVTLAVAEGVSAAVSVSMFDGEFTTEFPVLLAGLSSSREIRFTLGAGEATIIMKAFDGEVRLVRSR